MSASNPTKDIFINELSRIGFTINDDSTLVFANKISSDNTLLQVLYSTDNHLISAKLSKGELSLEPFTGYKMSRVEDLQFCLFSNIHIKSLFPALAV